MKAPRLRRATSAGAVAALLAVAAGCVNHTSNAEKFCTKNVELLDAASDNLRYSEDVAKYVSDQYEKTMRYAEDATKQVRLAARDMSDAYLEEADLASDDDATEKEWRENMSDLQKARDDTRDACAKYLDTDDSDGGT